jgi:NADPH:quinone reductase-like Zn-dependent oxidoreductase
MKQTQTIPETFLGVGYTRDRAGLPLEAVRVPVPQPAADQVLIRVAASSLNPLEYKLADLNFMGRTPPVVLGLDLAGVVVAVGHGVSGVAVGDAVAAMADLNGDGGWVATGGSGGEGGYAVARQFLTVRKPPSLSFRDAAALPMCFLSAFASLYRAVQAGDTVYIPGGGGGVGHLAVQMAARALGAGLVISSGSTPQSIALARQSGAHHVFDYKRDDIAAEIAKLTSGWGVDLVFDATQQHAIVDIGGVVDAVGVDQQRASDRGELLDAAAKAGLVGRKRVLDSTPLYDAVATMDTITLIRSAACSRQRARSWPPSCGR